MADKKRLFVLTFLVLYFTIQNVYAQPGPGESESSNGKNGSPDPGNSDVPTSSGTQQNPEMSNTQEEGQSESGNSGSENSNGENGSSNPGNSDDPASSGTQQESRMGNTEGNEQNQSGNSGSENNNSENGNSENSSSGEKSSGEKPSDSEFENMPIIYQATDFVLNPVEGATRIFLEALRKSGDAVLDTMKEFDSDVGKLVSQLGGIVEDPSQIPDLIANVVKGTSDLAGNTVSRFGDVASDTLENSIDGIGQSINEGGLLLKSVMKATANGTEAAIDTVVDGVTGAAEETFKAAVDFIVKDCVWYRVGFTNSCIPFRIWKLVEFPFKLTLNTAILPVKIAINAALLPITLPLMAITLPFELATTAFDVGGFAIESAGDGAELGVEGVEAATPVLIDAAKIGIEAGGQFVTRLAYHVKRFVGIFIP